MEGGIAGVNLGRASIFDWPLQGVVHMCCDGGKTVGGAEGGGVKDEWVVEG